MSTHGAIPPDGPAAVLNAHARSRQPAQPAIRRDASAAWRRLRSLGSAAIYSVPCVPRPKDQRAKMYHGGEWVLSQAAARRADARDSHAS